MTTTSPKDGTTIPLFAPVGGVCSKWRLLVATSKVAVNVRKGQRLLSIKDDDGQKEVVELVSPCSGKLRVDVLEGDRVVAGQCLGSITEDAPCEHPVFYGGVCCKCGMSQSVVTSSTSSSSSSSGSSVPTATAVAVGVRTQGAPSSLLVSGGHRLVLSTDEASRVQQQKTLALRNARKLALVLDLDHTLIHATGAWGAFEGVAAGAHRDDDAAGWDIKSISIDEGVPGAPPKSYFIKLRPHLAWFLAEAHKLCSLTIYTAGTRKYAEAVARAIDPGDAYFQGRIVSRSDIPNDKSDGLDKSLERIFLADASMAVIMDDREDVWRGRQAEQLILVRPFHFFVGVPEVNNASGPATAASAASSSSSASSAQSEGRAAAAPTAPPQSTGPIIMLSGERPGVLVAPADAAAAKPLGFQLRMNAGLRLQPSLPSTGATSLCADTVPAAINAVAEYDDQLPRCLSLLQDIHRRFYDIADNTGTAAVASIPDPMLSVSRILSEIKTSTLRGCVIAFSGIIPVNDVNPQNHHCWRLAVSLGARVVSDITADASTCLMHDAIVTSVLPHSRPPCLIPGSTSHRRRRQHNQGPGVPSPGQRVGGAP